MNIGFDAYDTAAYIAPTTQEILDALTSDQKVAVLDGFANKVPVIELKHSSGVHSFAIWHLYRKIDEIEERARVLMRGTMVITPAVLDENGEVTTPAIYNTPPSTALALKNAIASDFVDDFTDAQVTAILTKMINYSKHDGSGDWVYYKNNIIL